MIPYQPCPPPTRQTSCLRPRLHPPRQRPTLKEAAKAPINAKAVAATTAFELPESGQNLTSIHRTTTPTPLQEIRHRFLARFSPGLSP